jgi:uncharacterized phage protein (TIGR01671 family)
MKNREIKFRIWDKISKTLIYDNLSPFWFHIPRAINGQDEIEGESNLISLSEILAHFDFDVQQYTGLKDKNGVLIFESDLVQYNQNSNYDEMNFEVVWSDASFGWVLKSKTGDYLINQITPNGPRYNFLEVVGNIIQNPELIKN